MKKVLFVDYEEIGAILFSYAKAINEYNSDLNSFYVSFGGVRRVHDSNKYHFGLEKHDWDLTRNFGDDNSGDVINNLESKIQYLQKTTNNMKFDIIIATGKGGYLCSKAGLKYYCWVYGSDIEQQAFNIKSFFHLPQKQQFVHNYINTNTDIDKDDCFLQSLSDNYWIVAIKNAYALSINPRTLNHLKKIRKTFKLFFLPYLVPDNSILHNQYHREKQTKIFLSSTRHCWGEDRAILPDRKGNNIFIKAIALYREKSGDLNFEIHLINKGFDVKRTRNILEELGLSNHTKWFDEMKRDELYRHYNASTLCFGQFGTNCLEFSAVEPMSLGIPTISWYGLPNESPLKDVPFYESQPPLFNSRDPHQISQYMAEILGNKKMYTDVAQKSYQWCREYCSVEQLVNTLLKLIDKNPCMIKNIDSAQQFSDVNTNHLRNDISRWFSLSFQLLQDYQQIHHDHEKYAVFLKFGKFYFSFINYLSKYPFMFKIVRSVFRGLRKILTH